jgi:polar amino acid transport system substrate-binding protein
MAHGRVNAIAGAIPTIQYFARESAVDHLLGSPLVFYFEPIYLQCSRYSSYLQYMEVINQAIQEMKEDATQSKILKKYKY